jgi:hypothetical protein
VSEVVDMFPGVHVLALRRDQKVHRWHEIAEPIEAGDILVALGTPEHLAALVGARA